MTRAWSSWYIRGETRKPRGRSVRARTFRHHTQGEQVQGAPQPGAWGSRDGRGRGAVTLQPKHARRRRPGRGDGACGGPWGRRAPCRAPAGR